jgi:hypothetical protein
LLTVALGGPTVAPDFLRPEGDNKNLEEAGVDNKNLEEVEVDNNNLAELEMDNNNLEGNSNQAPSPSLRDRR